MLSKWFNRFQKIYIKIAVKVKVRVNHNLCNIINKTILCFPNV